MESREYFEQTVGGLESSFVLIRYAGEADSDTAHETWIDFQEPHLFLSDGKLRITLDKMDSFIHSLIEIRKLMWAGEPPMLTEEKRIPRPAMLATNISMVKAIAMFKEAIEELVPTPAGHTLIIESFNGEIPDDCSSGVLKLEARYSKNPEDEDDLPF